MNHPEGVVFQFWGGNCYQPNVDLENEIRGLIRLLGIKLPGTLNMAPTMRSSDSC